MAGAGREVQSSIPNTDDRLNAINGSDGAAVFMQNQGGRFYLFTYCCTPFIRKGVNDVVSANPDAWAKIPRFHLVTDEILGQIRGLSGK